jgi:5-formyltetrahydrofolate cyclo-ligase
MISEEKSRLRKKVLAKRKKLSPVERVQQALEIEKKFFALPEYASARVIAFYASKVDEVSTDDLIKKSLQDGKRILLPRIAGKNLIWGEIKDLHNLEIGEFAVREPPHGAPIIDLEEVDLLVAPVVVCDPKKNRMGYGTGFYDRALNKFEGTSVGLAFDVQIVPEVPVEKWDEKLDKIISG